MHQERLTVLAVLVLSLVGVAAGVVILELWLFPVVQMHGDTVLIGQNPLGMVLAILGVPGSIWSVFQLRRDARRKPSMTVSKKG